MTDFVGDLIEGLVTNEAILNSDNLNDSEMEQNAPESPEEERKKGPAERLVIPADVTDFNESDESIFVIGTKEGKVTKIAGLENMKNIKELVLRCCLVSSMQGIETLTSLTKLELYDNQLERISCIEYLPSLTILDISFNSIRDMSPVSKCPLLEEIYIAQNKLRTISGLENMPHLRVLDLGANRIRVSLFIL